jgi:hypothetical protein
MDQQIIVVRDTLICFCLHGNSLRGRLDCIESIGTIPAARLEIVQDDDAARVPIVAIYFYNNL